MSAQLLVLVQKQREQAIAVSSERLSQYSNRTGLTGFFPGVPNFRRTVTRVPKSISRPPPIPVATSCSPATGITYQLHFRLAGPGIQGI